MTSKPFDGVRNRLLWVLLSCAVARLFLCVGTRNEKTAKNKDELRKAKQKKAGIQYEKRNINAIKNIVLLCCAE